MRATFGKIGFHRALKPIKIGQVTVPNRIVLLPINTSFGDKEGNVTDRLIRFHQKIAKGRVGLSIVGSTSVSLNGKPNYFGLSLESDQKIDGFQKLFHAISDEGSIPAVQLMHAGRQTLPSVTGGSIVAPSSIPSPYFGMVPHELEENEIRAIIREFTAAGLRAKEAGAQIVELHGAHGYLIGQFLSPLSNKRSDEYGGNFDNRARFFCEIVRETKRLLGSSFPIVCRISISEYSHGGITCKDALRIAELLIQSGADCISVSEGIAGMTEKIYPTKKIQKKTRFRTGGEMRKRLGIPVICGGRIANLREADGVLEAGYADLVGMARALIADPHLILKSIHDDFGSIVSCTWCNKCVYDFTKFERMCCAVNPSL
ncbi:MAG: hypothetical protein ACFFB3_17920 [Candidatus Hodarchaeota archaeon]